MILLSYTNNFRKHNKYISIQSTLTAKYTVIPMGIRLYYKGIRLTKIIPIAYAIKHFLSIIYKFN